MQSISERDFDDDVGAAMSAAASEPVVIEKDGKPAFVLLSYTEFERQVAASVEDFS